MFAGKHVLITGGSSGIGLALAQRLAGRGAHLWLLARSREGLERAAAVTRAARSDPATRVEILSADVAQLEEVEAALAQLQEAAGPPDFLVNSAGVARPGYAEELELEIFHQMMDVNYFGTVHVTQLLLPAMLARGSGHIVNISSAVGFMGIFGYTAYGASKFAVRGYSDALRAELKGSGVGLSIVYPPDVDTPQLAYENQYKPAETKAMVGDRQPLDPQDVAKSIMKGIEQGRYVIIPDWEGRLFFWLSGALGTALYTVMDIVVARARRRAARADQAGGG